MAFSFMNELFTSGDKLDSSPFWVLMTLCWYVNEADKKSGPGKCWPSVKTIASKSHLSELTVRKALKALMNDGLVSASQPNGGIRTFSIHLDRLKDLAGGKEANPPKDVEPLKDLEGGKHFEGGPLNILQGTPERSLPTPLKDVEPEPVSEPVIEPVSNQEVWSDAQIADAPPPPTDEEIAAMCAQSEPADLFNGAVEMVGQPPEEKPKRKRAPLVTLPEKLPDDWRELAEERRPDIDPDDILEKMHAYYGPGERKAMKNWKATFRNWRVKERRYASNRNNRSSWEQPSPEVLASIDYGKGTWGY